MLGARRNRANQEKGSVMKGRKKSKRESAVESVGAKQMETRGEARKESALNERRRRQKNKNNWREG